MCCNQEEEQEEEEEDKELKRFSLLNKPFESSTLNCCIHAVAWQGWIQGGGIATPLCTLVT